MIVNISFGTYWDIRYYWLNKCCLLNVVWLFVPFWKEKQDVEEQEKNSETEPKDDEVKETIEDKVEEPEEPKSDDDQNEAKNPDEPTESNDPEEESKPEEKVEDKESTDIAAEDQPEDQPEESVVIPKTGFVEEWQFLDRKLFWSYCDFFVGTKSWPNWGGQKGRGKRSRRDQRRNSRAWSRSIQIRGRNQRQRQCRGGKPRQ